jgi:dipeptidyl aminopeptidase/acylaminoacyl peptidase/imidazolonepropionase-like amidohydrolase
MKPLLVLLLLLLLPAPLFGQPERPLVFTHVTVIDATGAPAKPNQTVVVAGGRLAALGQFGGVVIPADAQVVDATGKYLIPGLWDMHVHIVDRDSFLKLCLANGITGVREMANYPGPILTLRNQINEGKLLGPHLVMAGPILDGPKPAWPFSIAVANAADGRKAVTTVKKQGVDFVKVYSLLPRDGYFAIADEAKKQGLSFAGHVPESVSALEASDAGQRSIEHLFGVYLACSTEEAKLRKEVVETITKSSGSILGPITRTESRAVDSYSADKANALFARFIKNNTWQSPTLTVLRALSRLDQKSLTEDVRLKYIVPFIRTSFWNRRLPPEALANLKRLFQQDLELVRAMHRAGVPILAGTDTPNPYCFPGFSLHDELALLVQAGLSPMDALQCATRNPAKFLGKLDTLGTVEQGKVADLVLLDANPLNDIHNTQRIAAVVLGGKYLPRAALQTMLDEVEAGVRKLMPQGRQPEWTPEAMFKVKQVGSVQPSPDGKRIAYTVREAIMEGETSEYRTQIHVANTDGTAAYPMTQGEKSSTDPQWSPDGQWIAFTSSRSGKNNLWLIRVQGGEAEQLTDVKTGVTGFKWSPDSRQIAFLAEDPPTSDEEKRSKEKNDPQVVDENVKMSRLFVVPVARKAEGKRAARQLTTGPSSAGGDAEDFGPAAFDWSPDSTTIAFTHTRTPRPEDWSSADISLVDVASGTVRPLVHTGAAESNPLYSPDGKWIAYLASDNPPTWGFNVTVHLVPATGGTTRPLAETFDRGPTLVGWSADSQKIYYSEADGTLNGLFTLPLAGAPHLLGKTVGVLGNVQLNASRTLFGFSLETTTQPQEAVIADVNDGEPIRVSHINKDAPDLPLGHTEVVHWKAPDGLPIQGLLTYPVGYQKGTRYPLLLIVHGGPAGVFQQNFLATVRPYPVAVFAARGYAVLRCNPRGSGGYGKDFRYANYHDWGGGDYKDLMAGVDHVIALGVADKDRLGVMGWSYGGYMTSWIITQTHRFRAASVGAGVTHLESFTGTTDLLSFLPDYLGGEFWDRPGAYRPHSPLSHVKGVKTPTLIQHGEKDDRVPTSQGYELYNALKRQGCTVKMIVYPRMPHTPTEPRLTLDAMKRNLEWFDTYVRGPAK